MNRSIILLLSLSFIPLISFAKSPCRSLSKEDIDVLRKVSKTVRIGKSTKSFEDFCQVLLNKSEEVKEVKLTDQHTPLTDFSFIRHFKHITSIEIQSWRLKSIEPLTQFKELRKVKLDLINNNTLPNDLSPLSKLPNLSELHIKTHQALDLLPLAGLTELKSLSIMSYKKYLNIIPLKNLKKLEYIDIKHSILNTGSLKALSNLSRLKTLSLQNNQIEDISTLPPLKNLAHLQLNDNKIEDLSPLIFLTSLTDLKLNNNKIQGIEPLSSLKNLKVLELYNNSIENLEPLRGLTRLKELVLAGNRITTIKHLSSLINLERLYLNGNQLGDFDFPKELTKIRTLFLSGNGMNTIGSISSLPNLISLGLSDNNIEKIDELMSLKKLENLALKSNNITNIEPLSHLTGLKILYLQDNKIKSIDSLKRLTNLKELNLQNNAIEDIGPLNPLVNLSYLDLSKNNISVNVASLTGLVEVESLFLSNNSINTLPQLKNLPKLKRLNLRHNPLDSCFELIPLIKTGIDLGYPKQCPLYKPLSSSDNPVLDKTILKNSLLKSLINPARYHLLRVFLSPDKSVPIFFEEGFPTGDLISTEAFGVTEVTWNMVKEGSVEHVSHYVASDDLWPPKYKFLSSTNRHIQKAKRESCRNKYYEKIIKKYFTSKGLPTSYFDLMECEKIDFDHNGKMEVVFIARNYLEDDLEKKQEIKNPKKYQMIIGVRYLDPKTDALRTKFVQVSMAKLSPWSQKRGYNEYFFEDYGILHFFQLGPANNVFLITESENTEEMSGMKLGTQHFVYFENGTPKVMKVDRYEVFNTHF